MFSAAFKNFDAGALAVFAMLLFLGVFLAVLFRLYRHSDFSEVEYLPLNEEVKHE